MLDDKSIVSFAKDVTPPVELRNFWAPEDGFVWSTGKWCEVVFEYDHKAKAKDLQGEILLDFDAFKQPPEMEDQTVYIYLNGLRLGARRLHKRVTAFFDIRPGLLAASNTLVIDTPDVAAPSRFGGKDSRLLGIQLFSLQVRQIPATIKVA